MPDAPTAAGLALAAGALGASLLYLRRAFGPTRVRAVPVLRYGLVGPPRPGSSLNPERVPASRFDAQARHLARRGLAPVTLGEALRARGDRTWLARGPVVLTFDGPFAAFEDVCRPLLARHGISRATLFFPASALDLSELPDPEGGRPEPLLTPDALRRLAAGGVEVGLLVEPRALGADPRGGLARARARLGEATGRPVTLAALPAGAALGVRAALRPAGFEGAATAERGLLLRRTDPFAVPRFEVRPGTEVVDVALAVSSRVG